MFLSVFNIILIITVTISSVIWLYLAVKEKE